MIRRLPLARLPFARPTAATLSALLLAGCAFITTRMPEVSDPPHAVPLATPLGGHAMALVLSGGSARAS